MKKHLSRAAPCFARIAPSDAIPILEAITLNRIHPDAEAWAMLGRAHLASGTQTLALSAFNESLLIDSSKPNYSHCEDGAKKIGDLEGALTDYKKAHQFAPLSSVLSYEKGLVLLQLGRLSEAEGMLGIAARQLTTNPTLNIIHANCAYAIGNIDGATESLSEYLAENPKNPEPNAIYLAQVLQTNCNKNISRVERTPDSAKNLKVTTLNDPVIQYFNDAANRKEVLDWAGIAKSPKEARRQICEAAYWLAQHERINGHNKEATELLTLATQIGTPTCPNISLPNGCVKRTNREDTDLLPQKTTTASCNATNWHHNNRIPSPCLAKPVYACEYVLEPHRHLE